MKRLAAIRKEKDWRARLKLATNQEPGTSFDWLFEAAKLALFVLDKKIGNEGETRLAKIGLYFADLMNDKDGSQQLYEIGSSPRGCLMSAVELREKFRSRGWDEAAAPALRDQCEGAGKLAILHGPHNQKLTGLPEMVGACRTRQNEQGSILAQVPLATKPNRKRRRH